MSVTHSYTNLKLVEPIEKYYNFIRDTRNLDNGENFQKLQTPMTFDKIKLLIDSIGPDMFKVALLEDYPVGYILITNRNKYLQTKCGDVFIHIHPDYQKKGVGKSIMSEFLKIHPYLEAKVKINNNQSIGFFESLGFKKSHYTFTNTL